MLLILKKFQQTCQPPLQIIQFLDSYCATMGYERPIYNPVKTQVSDPDTGMTVQRYHCEISLPGTQYTFASPTYHANMDDAMTACAQSLLTFLSPGLPTYMQDTSNLLNLGYYGAPSMLLNPVTMQLLGMQSTSTSAGMGHQQQQSSMLEDIVALNNSSLAQQKMVSHDQMASFNSLLQAQTSQAASSQTAFVSLDSMGLPGLYSTATPTPTMLPLSDGNAAAAAMAADLCSLIRNEHNFFVPKQNVVGNLLATGSGQSNSAGEPVTGSREVV
ncbi:hypothetical protein Ciccas_005113 [Cichlidogyrus casuarinus]|uniref:Uncharacterized protein n=1 Tax=Cichlidogyrus casuarinus TaxID=1844966 RepID=A0ABD2Q9N5_9PLAT